MIDVWGMADSLGLIVVEQGGHCRSGYEPGETTIELTPGMKPRVARSVLAHEIGHFLLGHLPTRVSRLRAKQEAQANRWAANELITPEAYAAAERHRGGHVPSIAADLYVSEELVVVYQSRLMRTDRHVYVRPGLGAGRWFHREAVA